MSPHETQAATAEAQALGRSTHASGPRATLVFRCGETRALVDLIEGADVVVGRSSACDLRIDEPSLSRQHARFVCEGTRVRVDDLGSRNGVSVRGERVARAHLAGGEEALLGNVRVSPVVFAAESAPTPGCTATSGELEWAGRGMGELRRAVEKIAPTPLPVLVFGETGCGKELIARELHRLSPRASAPLQVVNCAAIPENLVESTLFGHERGAFTGADRAQAGAFEQAKDGTIFLDELGELPLGAQAALLRVLESGSFNRVGSTREQRSDARIVAATHRDLHAMVQQGTFRLDLLHRLDAVSLQIPPLRTRMDALGPLAERFLRSAEQRMNKTRRHLGEDTLQALASYAWPGNVRELRNVIERAVAIADSPLIRPEDLPDRVRQGTTPPAAVPSSLLPSVPVSGPLSEAPDLTSGARSLKERHEQEECALLRRALEQTGGSQTEAAARLGWSLRTLQRRAKKYGLTRQRSGS